MDATSKPSKKLLKAAAPDASDLPPINEIAPIFDDLVSHIPEIKDVAEQIAGRKLRVATMCSGTESPLLALELIQKSIFDQHAVNFDIEHVFSCEIEPFKQAYIERNFHPPILFRDVCELGDGEAHTAYGALAPVPGDVDILIAGTSCVDYSNLNNQKQDIDAKGESGQTFRGMMSWVTQHRPPLVILENVCSAPWDRVQEYFEKQGYSAAYARVDTKAYYIPHTRTRVYLFAVNKKNSSIPDTWKQWVTSKLKRPASSTLDAFLLPSDDPRIHQARQKLVQESFNGMDRRTGRTDWGRCESRHQRARLEEALGSKRPLTSWDEGGFCKLPDFAWNDWGVGQVERVWDLMDISLLRSATKGVDPSFKTQVWNLSQNVDRTIGSNKVGICPCLTPSMIPYITNRGGPMVGLEALAMQGLPVDKLLLTRETEDQLADLAGNAMSTTVVGACILAALVSGKKLLKDGDDAETYEGKYGSEEVNANVMVVNAVPATIHANSQVIGEERLEWKPLDLSVVHSSSFSDLLAEAEQSKRLCACEGRNTITNRPLFRCLDCYNSFCKKCGGRPEHSPTPIDTETKLRVHPTEFSRKLKSTLPMCITFEAADQSLLDELRQAETSPIKASLWSKWSTAVVKVTTSELRFAELRRQEVWSVIYRSHAGSLELSLHPLQPEWRLYANPDADEPANAEIRQVLQHAVGRFICEGDLLKGRWQFALPSPSSFNIKIQGQDELVPSWETRLGLIGEDFKTKLVYPKLKISVESDAASTLDRDISGIYALLDKCGTANGALHKKIDENDTGAPPLFMLFDPHRTNDSEDSFVFSTSIKRLEYLECRPIVCRLDPSWRQSSKEEEQIVTGHLPYQWVEATSVSLKAATGQNAKFGIPGKNLAIPVSKDACSDAYALLSSTVELRDQVGPEWPRNAWKGVDKIHERLTFRALAWLLERVQHVDDALRSWQHIHSPDDHLNCQRCSPTAPQLRWVLKNKKMVAVEDSVEAGEYERRLKGRPRPFVTQLKLSEDGTGAVRVGVNIPSLLHRAVSRLPAKKHTGKVTLSWRLDTSFSPAANVNLPPFRILSNKQDKEHEQPPHFKTSLRQEQLRSLEWMLLQESTNAPPFVEEEISEAMLDPLGWRAEGRAQRPLHVRGGVLADQVGYGKTAITLGLIDCTQKTVEKEFSKKTRQPGKISVKGTLIIVPPHLTKQWESEVKKFTGTRFKVHVITTASNLNSTKIEDIQEADMIVVASNIFKSGVYLENLQLLGGAGELPNKDGRHFNDQLEKTLEGLKKQVDLLQDEGSLAVISDIKAAQKRLEEEAAEAAARVASKRLKGKSYREAAESKSIKVHKDKPKPLKSSEDTKKELSPETKPKAQGAAKPTKSGLIPEVVITKAAKRAESDPWKLGSKAVQRDWQEMQAPPFEMFHFARVVVDEYTYLDGKVHALITKLSADRQWVLSGTPPIHDFGAVKTIAAFLNVHLGIHDEGEGRSAEVKKRTREQTNVEKFHSFREVHTLEWHAHRHSVGQAFLDQFNIAEIDEIPFETEIVKIVLPAAERAIYLELEHHLRSLDMTIKRGKKTESDREKRLAQSLGESKSAEEALLKRCSHFDLETSNDNAKKACDVIVAERHKQLEECKKELLTAIQAGVKREKDLGNVGQESMFQEYVRVCRTEGVDDQDSTNMVIELLDEASTGNPKAKTKTQDVQLSEKVKAKVWEHREKTHEIRRLTKELVGRVRSLRYFTVVRDLQKQTDTPVPVSCPACGRENVPIPEVAVLSSCGHMGCIACVRTCAEKEECVYAALGQCKSAARVLNVVKAETLGMDDERTGKGRHFGQKLEKVVELIKTKIKHERVLVFVQFPDLMKKVTEAFKSHKIAYLEIKGTAHQKSKNLELFQNDSDERVLLLNVMDESASGANLTSANHAIFLSPLLAPSQEIYTACETQAVGRLVRFGQTKLVNIYKFLTSDTIDEDIYQQREKALLARANQST
ncbi:hypothetical protein CPB83DRAFT_810873 [Crepidotus variabilis]|uniref:Helicase C-terminal domain-containing protein n=1 Tax=Crepidotus variabilis TaxID=179855 RepID=A0A9P6EJX8_9AGAR|nr:hypothetical protein CPB83DRAFT_810873 [Crepidotus variabilis]